MPMEAQEAIQRRRTIRKFTGEPVAREDVEKIVDAGRLAATGNSRQPWDFVVVTDREMIDRLKVTSEWLDKAGAIIAVAMDASSRWWVEDGAAAVENMLIASTALGYGSCWLEGYTLPLEEEFKTLLNVPKDRRLLTLVPIGVSAESPTVEKKPLEEVTHWERW